MCLEPKTVKEIIYIDKENDDALWWDAIMKEMKNVRPAFEVWEKRKEYLPIGYQEIKCRMIFEINLGENFRRKSRLVGGGHKTATPALITYSLVVSRDYVRITLKIAALNELDILACDIQMYGVPIEGPTGMFCDNKAVYKNSSTPESVLRKKHHIIAYHMCPEAVSAGICRIAKEYTDTNLADIFTKVVPRPRREQLLNLFTY